MSHSETLTVRLFLTVTSRNDWDLVCQANKFKRRAFTLKEAIAGSGRRLDFHLDRFDSIEWSFSGASLNSKDKLDQDKCWWSVWGSFKAESKFDFKQCCKRSSKGKQKLLQQHSTSGWHNDRVQMVVEHLNILLLIEHLQFGLIQISFRMVNVLGFFYWIVIVRSAFKCCN